MKSTQSKWAGKSFMLEPIWRAVYAKLEEQLPSQAMEEWVDHLHLIRLNRKRAVILLTGDGDLQEFLWQYEALLTQYLRGRCASSRPPPATGSAAAPSGGPR